MKIGRTHPSTDSRRFRAIGRRHLDRIQQLDHLSQDQRTGIEVASLVLPFRVNEYVLEELIDWNDIPDDPIFQLTFPQGEMLERDDFLRLRDLLERGAPATEMREAALEIQLRMNPHPAGQVDFNVPAYDGVELSGCQHKYSETVLFFPKAGQSCHAFCTYCFRWPQFVGVEDLKFAMHEVDLLVSYLRAHREVTDVLVTGGDPLVMSSAMLRKNIEPLLGDGLEHVTSIRIGTKALSYWPHRFTSDHDADDLLRLIEEISRSGRQLALMAHFSHPRELATNIAEDALRRVRDAGAVVRCQAPIIRHVNNRVALWSELWREEVRLGAVPYYMFVARNTGPRAYFEIPLAESLRIFSAAYARVSGLGRTVRGPVMSATPGKVMVLGTAMVGGEQVFVLKMIQGRDPRWVNQIFFAAYDSDAAWFDQLRPAFGAPEFSLNGLDGDDGRTQWTRLGALPEGTLCRGGFDERVRYRRDRRRTRRVCNGHVRAEDLPG